jgi:hypothetical protein
VVVHAVASGDADYNGMAVPDLAVRIADDDVVGATITETDDSTALVEGGSDSFLIVLDTEPVADVSITVTPDAQLDLGLGLGVPVVLTFAPADWSEPQTTEVTAPDNAVADGPRTASITFAFAGADPAYAGLLVPPIIVPIADNDTAGVTILESDGSTRVVEGGETDSYTIRLNTEPSGSVIVTVTPEGPLDVGAGAGASITLVFTPLNWQTPQTVTVAAAGAAGGAAASEARISHAVVSDDPAYTPRSGGDLSEPEPDEVIIKYTTVHGLCGVGVCAPLLAAASCLLGIKKHGARAAAGRARRGRRDDGGPPSNGGH